MSQDPVFALADHVVGTIYDALPESAIAATKRDLMDTFGCALGGSGAPGIPEILRLLRHWGGREDAGLLLVGGRLPAPQAAMVHGAMGHALDYDDTLDEGGSIHPGVTVLASTLAMADLLGNVTGKDAILAATLGLDVASRIALAATLDRGWHRTSAIGIFGATAVAGKLLGLSSEQLAHAFGIAYSQAAGNRQCIVDGALTKRLQAGQGASSAIMAALLAKEGFTGAAGVFAGKFGFYELYQPNGFNLAPLLADLGHAWRGEMVSFKPYPCGRPMHAPIDAALALQRGIGAAGIAEVVVGANPAALADQFAGAAHKRAPTQIVQAQFALPFLISAALLRGRVGIAELNAMDAPDVLALSARITAEPVAQAPFGAAWIRVRLTDGRVLMQDVTAPRGSPALPLTDAERVAKFRDCAAHAVRPIADATVDRGIDMLGTLEAAPDMAALTRLFG
jgi:2-methylcitrate dehydratase PrpD